MKDRNMNERSNIRKTWDIKPETKTHGERKDRTFNRRSIRQVLNGIGSNVNPEDLEDIDFSEYDE